MGDDDDTLPADQFASLVGQPTSGPVTSPDQSPSGAAPQLSPDGVTPGGDAAIQIDPAVVPQMAVKNSAGVQQSHSGIPGGTKRVTDIYEGARQQAAKDEAPYQAQYDQEQANTQRDYGEARDAAKEEGDVTRQHYDDLSTLYKKQQDTYQQFGLIEQHAAQNAKADAQQYITSYKEQLAGVRQLMMQSGDPMGNLTFSQKSGLGIAAFAQGFLAARGINIDVTGQIDKWVNRSIAEHQQQIENAKGLANDQLHLYEIARQTSQDDAEARQRYRGFVIEGMKTSLLANASRFSSDIANAQAKAAVAKLDIEADANSAQIQERRQTMVHSFDMMRITEAKDRAQDEFQKQELAIKWAHEQNEKDKQKPVKPVPNSLLISDPEYIKDAKGNEIKDANGSRIVVNGWKVDGSQPPEIQNKVLGEATEARTGWANYKDATDLMMTSYQKAEKIAQAHPNLFKAGGWEGLQRFDSSGAVADFLQSQNAWVMAKVYNTSGKQVNEEEFKRQADQARADLKFETNSAPKVERLQTHLMEDGRKNFQRRMEIPGLIKVDPSDPQYHDTSRTASPTVAAVNDATLNGGEPTPQMAADQADLADVKSGKTMKPSALWNNLTGGSSKYTYDSRLNSVDWLAQMVADPAGYRKIHNEAAKGDETAHAIPDDDGQLVDQAMTTLQQLAATAQHEDVQKYATAILSMAKDNPGMLKGLVMAPSDSKTPEGFPSVEHAAPGEEDLNPPSPQSQFGSIGLVNGHR